jgi:glucosamine-6-phosphate deaminase
MRVAIEKDEAAAAERAAAVVARLVRSRHRCILGLASGRTMEPVYASLTRQHRGEGLSFRDVSAFGLDEYIGAATSDPWGFHAFLRRHLVNETDLPRASVHLPNGKARDVFAEAARFERAIERAGGIDLQLLGLGRNGHLGFNQPGSSLGSRTRVKALTRETLTDNRDDLPDLGDAKPSAAITMGLATILATHACLLLAVGAAKAAAVAAMVEGPLAARVPASVLQLHPKATVVLDEAAAAQLERVEYYRRAEEIQRELEGPRRGP